MKYLQLLAALASIGIAGCGHKLDSVVAMSGSNPPITQDVEAAVPSSTTPEPIGAEAGQKKAAPATRAASRKMSKDKVTAADLGLPLYPGSVEDPNAGPSLISDDKEARRVISFRTTKDEPKKVLAFYMGKILITREGDGSSNMVCCGGKRASLLHGTLRNGADAKMVANLPKGRKLTVVEVTVKTLKKH